MVTPFKDHLHIRGEYNFSIFRFFIFRGSPPHTWRIQIKFADYNPRIRITSTYVENTNFVTCCWRDCQDHLHIRGEYGDQFISFLISQGSPPHTWRILTKDIVSLGVSRITSTYVENTLALGNWLDAVQDHLHIRGEYCLGVIQLNIYLGSPPHTWRIRCSDKRGDLVVRITSTYVENTLLHHLIHLQYRDHLHIRGEYFIPLGPTAFVTGSPPHTWRIPLDKLDNIYSFRITSTYVENTLLSSFLYRPKMGSPPHTWRILYDFLKEHDLVGITSTYVENT